jgi:hypothetical protein
VVRGATYPYFYPDNRYSQSLTHIDRLDVEHIAIGDLIGCGPLRVRLPHHIRQIARAVPASPTRSCHSHFGNGQELGSVYERLVRIGFFTSEGGEALGRITQRPSAVSRA